jgi:hypothetical protein
MKPMQKTPVAINTLISVNLGTHPDLCTCFTYLQRHWADKPQSQVKEESFY